MESSLESLPQANLTSGAASIGPVSYGDALENYISNTNWWVVFASFDLPDFDSSPLWISQKTNIAVKEVVEALEGLAVLGLLKKENGGFSPIRGKESFKIDVRRKPKAEILEDHALIASQILNQLQEDSLVAIDHRCFAGNIEILQELYSDIAQAFEKACSKSKSLKNKDRIFKMTFTAVDVLANAKKGKGI